VSARKLEHAVGLSAPVEIEGVSAAQGIAIHIEALARTDHRIAGGKGVAVTAGELNLFHIEELRRGDCQARIGVPGERQHVIAGAATDNVIGIKGAPERDDVVAIVAEDGVVAALAHVEGIGAGCAGDAVVTGIASKIGHEASLPRRGPPTHLAQRPPHGTGFVKPGQ